MSSRGEKADKGIFHTHFAENMEGVFTDERILWGFFFFTKFCPTSLPPRFAHPRAPLNKSFHRPGSSGLELSCSYLPALPDPDCAAAAAAATAVVPSLRLFLRPPPTPPPPTGRGKFKPPLPPAPLRPDRSQTLITQGFTRAQPSKPLVATRKVTTTNSSFRLSRWKQEVKMSESVAP